MGIHIDEIEKRFTAHPVNEKQVARMENLRSLAQEFAMTIVDDTPESREQSLALTHLEEAMFWANAAISRRES